MTHLPPDYLSGSIYLGGPPFLGEDLAKIVTTECLAVLPLLMSTTCTSAEYEDALTRFSEGLYSTPKDVPIETKWLWRGMMSSAPPASYGYALQRKVDPSALFAIGKKGYPLHVIAGADEALLDGVKLVALLKPEFTKLTWHYVEKGGHSVFHQNVQETIESITKFVGENRWNGVVE